MTCTCRASASQRPPTRRTWTAATTLVTARALLLPYNSDGFVTMPDGSIKWVKWLRKASRFKHDKNATAAGSGITFGDTSSLPDAPDPTTTTTMLTTHTTLPHRSTPARGPRRPWSRSQRWSTETSALPRRCQWPAREAPGRAGVRAGTPERVLSACPKAVATSLPSCTVGG